MIFTILLLACSDDAPEEAVEDTATDTDLPSEDAPYLAEPDESTAPDFISDDVAAAVEGALLLITQLDVGPIVSVYSALLAQSDSTCPLWSDYKGTPLWYDTCTADAGVSFSGYGLTQPWEGTDDGSGNRWWGTQIYSIATITDADGQVLTTGGSVASLTGVSADGAALIYALIEGSFSWDGPEAAGTWLDWGSTPSITWFSLRDPDSGGQVITVSGAITIDDGPIAAVVLDNIYLTDELLGSSCGEEPSGTISVLDSDGRWYDLIFDGPTDAVPEVAAGVCDGCATVWYRGSPLGEACVDFSILRS
ncbi:MAG: hypothetical protein P8R54_13280 [Myxococcota bacterium]|nr:hypothetical protein [Myxococcota bacterium]